jgi:hypothetical protein
VIQSPDPAIGQSCPDEEPEDDEPDDDEPDDEPPEPDDEPPEPDDEPPEPDEPPDDEPPDEPPEPDDEPPDEPPEPDEPLELAFASDPLAPPDAFSAADEPSRPEPPPVSVEPLPDPDESPPPAAAFAAAFVIAALAVPRSFFAQPVPLNTKFGAAIALRSAWAWQFGHCVGPWSWTPWRTSKRYPQAPQT